MESSELRDADDSEIGKLRTPERELAILLAEEHVEEIDPACSGVASGVAIGAMITVTGARTAALTGASGGMIVAIAVPSGLLRR